MRIFTKRLVLLAVSLTVSAWFGKRSVYYMQSESLNPADEDRMDIPMRYHTPHNATWGKPFQVSQDLLKTLGVPPTKFVTLTEATLNDTVFVIGSDVSHFEECIDSVASIQHHRPWDKIIYYDLGLNQTQVNQVKTFCNVEYREFDYKKYPAHVKDLMIYSFKFLIMWEVLQERSGVFWFDCSVRLRSSSLEATRRNALAANGGLTLKDTIGSIFGYTLPETFNYLPVNLTAAKIVRNRAAIFLIYKTKELYRNVLHWWLLCSLEEACIAPKRKMLGCYPGHVKFPLDRWAGCHRYDMSVINILFANYFNYSMNVYLDKKRIVDLDRYVTHHFNITLC